MAQTNNNTEKQVPVVGQFTLTISEEKFKNLEVLVVGGVNFLREDKCEILMAEFAKQQIEKLKKKIVEIINTD